MRQLRLEQLNQPVSRLVATVTADTQPGVVVVEGSRGQARYLSGGPLNVLTSDHLSDMGAGATYQSTWVEAAPLEATPA